MLNRMNDYFIKYLLGKPRNKGIALNFINAALGEAGRQFVDIIYTDKDADPVFAGEKASRLDIKGVLDDGTIVDIEMQVAYYEHMAERSLFYWSRMYGEQLKESEDYGVLKQCVAINLLDFDYLNESNWVNKYKVLNVDSKEPLTNHLYMAFLELPKFIRQLKKETKALKKMSALELWATYFCRLASDQEMEAIPMLDMALVAEKYFTADAQERRQYERREAFLRDQISFAVQAKKAEEKAAKKGRAEGRAEGINLINALNAKLMEQNRLEDMKRAMKDERYREQLIKELLPENACQQKMHGV